MLSRAANCSAFTIPIKVYISFSYFISPSLFSLFFLHFPVSVFLFSIFFHSSSLFCVPSGCVRSWLYTTSYYSLLLTMVFLLSTTACSTNQLHKFIDLPILLFPFCLQYNLRVYRIFPAFFSHYMSLRIHLFLSDFPSLYPFFLELHCLLTCCIFILSILL